MYCKTCGAEINNKEAVCKNCGSTCKTKTKPKLNGCLVGCLIVGCIPLGIFIIWLLGLIIIGLSA